MRKKIFNHLILLAFVFLFVAAQSFAQRIVQVPPDQGGNIGSLNETILSDTNATGERNDPNTIYELERGKIYFINGAISNDETWHLHIRAASTGDEKPPVIMSGILDDGSRAEIPIWAGGDLTLDGIWFYHYSIVQGQDQATHFDGSVFSLANESRNVIQNCIFDGFHVAITAKGNWQDWLVQNNHFRNGVSHHSWYIGHVLHYDKVPCDTLIMRNNTMFNNGGFTCTVTMENYFLFEHNTIVGNHVNPLIASGDWNGGTNRDIKNNIFYATFNKGIKDHPANILNIANPTKDDSIVVAETWTCSDGYYWAVTDIDTLSKYQRDTVMQMSEADRHINWENNAYFWPQALTDVYAKHSDSLIAPKWANEHTDMFFNDPNYPNLNMSGNIEADPGFNADIMETMANTAKYVEGFIYGWASGDWSKAPESSNYLHRYPNEAAGDTLFAWYPPFALWPLGEDLKYSNVSMQTAGTDGKPLGDLNWWKGVVGVNPINDIVPGEFELSQNYPNPFNPSTVISYSVPKASQVSLAVFNMLGQKVIELVNEKVSAGNYQIKYNASSLASGLYFYSLEAGDVKITKKMMLLK